MSEDLELHLPAHLRRRRGKRLTNLQLSEISIVTMPANPGAMAVLHKSNAAQEVPMTAAEQTYIEASASAAVAVVLAKMTADAAAARAALARMLGGSVQKASQDGAVVAEAVRAAQAGEDHPPVFWRAALRALGEQLEPDAPPSAQAQAALGSGTGRWLTVGLTGDRRILNPNA